MHPWLTKVFPGWSRPFEGDFLESRRPPFVVVVHVKFWRRWACTSAAMVAAAGLCVRVLVDFCDLFDFVETGMFATFWDATGTTELRLMVTLVAS